MSNPIQHRSIVVLKIPTQVSELVKTAETVVQAMTGNAAFLNPNPPLATVTSLSTRLDAAETAARTRAVGTRQARDQARNDLVTALHGLKGYVQLTADAAGEAAPAVIASAGMGVRKPAQRNKAILAAKAGPTSGTVHLVAKAATRRASYEWQWSADGGKTWTLAPSSLQAKTTILGLPVATTVEFRFRPVTRTGEGDWSQIVAFVVK